MMFSTFHSGVAVSTLLCNPYKGFVGGILSYLGLSRKEDKCQIDGG